MLAFRSVVSVLLRALGDFLHTLEPGLPAAACGGRPRAGSDATVPGEPTAPWLEAHLR
jgi:hypothetical protein